MNQKLNAPADFQIGSHRIGRGHAPFFIAEMSGNHNQSLEQALSIVRAAARAGAHALKLQTYTANTITLNCDGDDFKITDPKSLWNGERLFDLYAKASTPWEWHEAIFSEARKLGMLAFSSPFDVSAVDFLEKLGVPAYKIASFEITHFPLLERVAATKRPTFISTGMASETEIADAIEIFERAGNRQICLFKCTSAYPAQASDAQLSTICDMQKKFGVQVGLSDHTLGWTVPVVAVALGAVAIEKHFTLDRAAGGVDSAFSLEPQEFASMIAECTKAVASLGAPHYGPSAAEENSLKYRQSIYVAANINAGEIFDERNIRIVRPGFGLEPRHYKKILGRKAKKNLRMGERLNWELID